MWLSFYFCAVLCCSNVASGALLRHELKVNRADGKGVQKKDLLDMLTSLNEVVVSMDKEHKAFRDLSNARETSCRTTKAGLEKSLNQGNLTLQTAQKELSKAMNEVDSIQGGVNTVKEKMKTVNGEISALQSQLAKLRAERQASIARDNGYSQQVKAILEKAKRRISQVWTRSGAHKSEESDEAQVEDIKALMLELSHDAPDEKRTAENVPKAEAAEVNKAAKKAQEAFEIKELKLMELIKSKRAALKPLQSNLAKRQPELADQLRKISEANRTVVTTKLGLKRDKKVLERSQGKCAVLFKAKKFETDQRPQVRVQVIMAISFLKAMARKSGIELNPGAQGPSFLQLESSEQSQDNELSQAVRSALEHIESIDDSRYGLDFKVDALSNISDDVASVPLESNLVQVDAAQKEASAEEADSLKNVKEMIKTLIASLREEQNEDQEKQKFCAEQLKKTQEKAKKLKTAQEEVEQSKQWTKNAVNDLEEQARFIENEVAFLNEAKTTSKTELDAEVKRVEDEVKNHEATTDVMSKSQQVLVTQCKLSEDDLSSNCAEANAALRRAVGGLKELDQFLASYVVELTKVANEQKVEIDATLNTQKGSLFQARADLNKRKDELAQLASDVVKAKENLILASKADSALQTNCGPKVSSKEDMIATRKEQIDQLKNAVLVLDGQVFG